jgi:hypothetical protein
MARIKTGMKVLNETGCDGNRSLIQQGLIWNAEAGFRSAKVNAIPNSAGGLASQSAGYCITPRSEISRAVHSKADHERSSASLWGQTVYRVRWHTVNVLNTGYPPGPFDKFKTGNITSSDRLIRMIRSVVSEG